jgi:hypothetical protein
MNNATLEEPGIGTRIFLTAVNRQQIESLDFGPIFKLLGKCGILDPSQAEPENLTNLQFKVCFTVDGYRDETHELVEIPEVCRYFQELHQAWPYGLYFFNPHLETLQLLVWCNAGAMLSRDEDGEITGVKVPADKLQQFIYSAMPHFFAIAGKLGWEPDKATGQIANIAGLFETSEPDCQPGSNEELKSRHLAAIKSYLPTLGNFASESHRELGRGSVMVVDGQINYLAESDMADLGTEASVDALKEMIRQYNPAAQFVICFCSVDGNHSYTIDSAVNA